MLDRPGKNSGMRNGLGLVLGLFFLAVAAPTLYHQCAYIDHHGQCNMEGSPPGHISKEEKVARFYRAAGMGVSAEVKYWLEAGLDVDTRAKEDGNTMLWTAVRSLMAWRLR